MFTPFPLEHILVLTGVPHPTYTTTYIIANILPYINDNNFASPFTPYMAIVGPSINAHSIVLFIIPTVGPHHIPTITSITYHTVVPPFVYMVEHTVISPEFVSNNEPSAITGIDVVGMILVEMSLLVMMGLIRVLMVLLIVMVLIVMVLMAVSLEIVMLTIMITLMMGVITMAMIILVEMMMMIMTILLMKSHVQFLDYMQYV